MDVIQILVFLGIIGWGLFQARTQKQKKPKRVKTVRQAPPAASFSVEEEVPEEVILAPVPEARKKRRYTSAQPSTPKEQALNVPKKEEQKLFVMQQMQGGLLSIPRFFAVNMTD